ncbi:MAG: tetraacyldisaccharide 4'-kinase [Caulobacteraceae bacterium]
MNIVTPRWWYRRGGQKPAIARALLTPLSWAWAGATARRMARGRPVDPGIPVICVGNLTLGGTGKTPVVRELARLMARAGLDVHILARGHGGRLAGPVRVDGASHTAAEVGDEALMMALDAPVWVARDRAAAALAAASAGAQILIMDDGHQNPSVRKTLSLIVVDGETRDGEWPFGGGGVFPTGPLREPLSASLARADAVVVLLPADLPAADRDLLALFAGKPIVTAWLEPATPPPSGPQIAFAGLGKPWKMERALKAVGCDLVEFVALPDHAIMREAALVSLARRAGEQGAGLVTSEKDWIKLGSAWRVRVTAWPVRVMFGDEDMLRRLLAGGTPTNALAPLLKPPP